MDDSSLSNERAARRREILDAAVRNFAERGFANSRTKEIAEAAGVGEGTIYLYFEGKDDLLLTAFRERVAEFCEAVQQLLEERCTFAERLARFMQLQFEGIERDPDLAMVLLLESRQSTRFYGPPVREVLRDYAAAVESLIESGIRDGSVRADLDVRLARRMLIGTMEEIELDWLVGQRNRPLGAVTPRLVELLVGGLAARGT